MNFDSISPLIPLLQEVAKQTNPENFMEPYDARRVKRAAQLNAQVYEVDSKNPLAVLNLLDSTREDLECKYSAELVYQYLISIYKPTNPTNNNPDNFDWCNNLCQGLYDVRGSVSNMIHLIQKETAGRKVPTPPESSNGNDYFGLIAFTSLTIIAIIVATILIEQL